MKLSQMLSADRIRIPLSARTKDDVLQELVALLPSATDPERRERILDAILEREKRMSTGIGQGIAIPHGKSNLVQVMEMSFGISPRRVDFDSLDGDPCGIFFLLVSPPAMTRPHIKALARISRMLSSDSVRDELVQVRDADEVLALFRREESLEEE